MNHEANRSRPWKTGPSRDESGSVMLEFVIAFPLVLVLMLGCFQMAHLWIAKMVVHYAAFCAARSALVRPANEYQGAAQQAAQQVCDWMGTGLLQAKTQNVSDGPEWNVTAEVTGTFSLLAPVVGPIIAWGMNPWDQASAWDTPSRSGANTDSSGYPTITLTEKVTLPKPYRTMVSAN